MKLTDAQFRLTLIVATLAAISAALWITGVTVGNKQPAYIPPSPTLAEYQQQCLNFRTFTMRDSESFSPPLIELCRQQFGIELPRTPSTEEMYRSAVDLESLTPLEKEAWEKHRKANPSTPYFETFLVFENGHQNNCPNHFRTKSRIYELDAGKSYVSLFACLPIGAEFEWLKGYGAALYPLQTKNLAEFRREVGNIAKKHLKDKEIIYVRVRVLVEKIP